jgi:outer membrane immunogenic protein
MNRSVWRAASIVGLFAISGPAFAADMAPAYKAQPMAPPVALYNWTGFYIGGHIGGGWADERSSELAPGTVAFPTGTPFTGHDMSGFLGGVQGGFNWQAASNVVIGVEGEYTWEDLSATSSTTSVVNGFLSTTTTKGTDLALVTGRLGYAANNWLLYAKGGGAWGHGSSSGVGTTAAGAFFDTTSSSTDRSGWVVGAGVEWGFAPNWSAKLEYNHVDFGSRNVTIFSSTGTSSFVSSNETIDIVKAGINYRFNWGGPVVARY